MRFISNESIKKLFLLAIIEEFQKGVYGAKRLQKVTYFVEKAYSKKRPFTFKKWYYGQFSEELETVKEQLIWMGFVTVDPLTTGEGNRYCVSKKIISKEQKVLHKNILPGIHQIIKSTIKEIGYLTEKALLKVAYKDPLFKKAQLGEDILKENLPDKGISLPITRTEDYDEIELSLNPKFINSLLVIREGIDRGKLDLSKVPRIAHI